MGQVLFYLKGVSKDSFLYKDGIVKGNPESKKVRTINIYFRCADGKFRKSTEQKIKECDWVESDIKRKLLQRVEPRIKGADHINLILDDLEARVNKFIREKKASGHSIYIKDLEGLFPGKEEAETPLERKSFLEFFQKFTSDKNFEKVLVHLNSFNDYYNYNLDWPKLKDKFYSSYIHYMTEVYENLTTGEKGLFNSTLIRDTRCIKKVCTEARKLGIEVPNDFETFRRPKVIKRKNGSLVGKRAVVHEETITKLLNFNFYNKEYYPKRTNIDKVVSNINEVRDEYAFRFYTGLRLSDASKMLRENITNGLSEEGVIKVIDFAQKKTLNANVVPLNDECLRILAKYEGKKFTALPRFCNDYYNRICKMMFRILGMDKKITITRMKGEKMIVEVKEEWQLLTSHSARHSAATHLLNNGADLNDVKEFLGQEDIRSTQVYAELHQEVLNSRILKITNRNKEERKKVG